MRRATPVTQGVAMIRVMIVDDHSMVRSGLSFFLREFEDFEIAGEATNGLEAAQLCGAYKPDVILMDLKMPDMDGAAATRLIRERYPNIRVLILTSFPDDVLVQAAVQAGAIGYLLKNATAEELAQAVRAAVHGHATFAPEAVEALVRTAHQPPHIGSDLTEREREILALMVRGLTNPQIGARIFVSRATVRFHVSNILSKLNVNNRTSAVAVAVQANLVPALASDEVEAVRV
jgi:NarL family two-component system response regulator LiaR